MMRKGITGIIEVAGDSKFQLISPEFTAMVNCGDIPCKRVDPVTRGAKRKEKASPAAEGGTIRATISFPSETYRTLDGIAGQKKVSLAWVVREACEQYISDKWPLFRGRG